MTKESAPKPLDLSSLDPRDAANEGFEFELTHPVSKAPLGQFITVLGSDSDTYADILHERFNTAIRQRASGGDIKPKTSEQIDAEELELLVACTKGFRNINWHGEDLNFTHQNAITLYKIGWVKQQVNAAIVDISNFIKKSPV